MTQSTCVSNPRGTPTPTPRMATRTYMPLSLRVDLRNHVTLSEHESLANIFKDTCFRGGEETTLMINF